MHSNQPYEKATATAGGYSHSYETDSSGYALIYLNGPLPGAQITVTVGGATCTYQGLSNCRPPTQESSLSTTSSRGNQRPFASLALF